MILRSLILCTMVVLLPHLCQAGWLSDTFIDPSDGAFDASTWLLEKDGFMPVPVIITEPAVGYGGGLAAVYFHDKLGAKKGVSPSVSALVGAATENGTWFVGGGHFGVWDDDNIRYTGAIGTGLFKMQYYGLPDRNGVYFEMKNLLLVQEIQFRLGASPVFAGASYTFVDTRNTFKLTASDPLDTLPGTKFDSRVPH